MKNEIKNNDNCIEYGWSESLILDKIQELLDVQSIDDLELDEDTIENLKNKLIQNVSFEEINQSGYIIAKNVKELNVLPQEEIKDYILRLKNYLNNTTINCIKADFKGIEFEVYKNSSIDDVFKEYYSKYDESYGISQMLSDLGLK
ncbi:hypothetical protein C672_2106 [[Clostridium] bifermentans ATCC 638]|uniref:Uncharacterized protein n=1 Tax=Paraclostridium bifermentans ATCC 638 = DSM 14991 TaxID=1233171 RepID=T4VR60_PARBF|nr:hypothetical protein [Paraclostridium bifermentans]EQK43162.1 hypothetical protein C672_2106 [[Clostridium] bifermentans ATCC 638] [Paraclostridium bifermentans ATCC 638 = DSM 14991]RIZ60388.1 hypothetical protein CHH45_01060 [Paraclostridium bifermentans]UAG17030.1 hypothetical protein KXZ80_09555 [Paraclostridium bifermentans]